MPCLAVLLQDKDFVKAEGETLYVRYRLLPPARRDPEDPRGAAGHAARINRRRLDRQLPVSVCKINRKFAAEQRNALRLGYVIND